MLTSTAIKAQALDLGFDLCGIARAEAYPELSALRAWIDRGYAGTMSYLARTVDRRDDVRAVLPSARSVIVTGTLYNVDRPYSIDRPDAGQAEIARYAWGDDYHAVLGRRLDQLLSWMRAQSPEPFEAKPYVDTGPVQERVYAQHAGLGWIGRNTCLINETLGSWLFLAEIVCSLDLDADAPGLDQCGLCTRCLDACPTGALTEPHVLDATRCIAYLTIELREEIPGPLRPAIGAHVYGCDVCQEVCPWNRDAPASADPAWQPQEIFDGASVEALWRLDDTTLRRALRRSAMSRAKLTGLRRNLAVALGNGGDAGAAEALDEARREAPSCSEPLVQEHAAWSRARLARARDGRVR